MFKEIKVSDLNENFIDMIAKEFMLITAGDKADYNMMTASWGFMGEIWGADSVAAVIRPSRYTMEYVDKCDTFSLSFYGEKGRDIHKICGFKSGRDVNKTKECGLHPVFSDNTVYFEEARLVFIIKKQYVQPMAKEFFTDSTPDEKWYDGEYHNIIIGKIEKVYINE